MLVISLPLFHKMCHIWLAVLKECCDFILSRHMVVKIHCNRVLDFNIKKIQENAYLKNCFFM